MPTPPKPFSVLKSEKKSHRTKAELKKREEGEKAQLTGVVIEESTNVKNNKFAHELFTKTIELLSLINKNDAIFGNSINRYCMISAEINNYEERIMLLNSEIKKLSESYDKKKIEAEFYFQNLINLNNQVLAIDRQLQQKRKMLFDIEKESVMTVASALRNVDKKVEKKSNKLLEALNN
jgi:uncharacterized small protein (DUF1192 family)